MFCYLSNSMPPLCFLSCYYVIIMIENIKQAYYLISNIHITIKVAYRHSCLWTIIMYRFVNVCMYVVSLTIPHIQRGNVRISKGSGFEHVATLLDKLIQTFFEV